MAAENVFFFLQNNQPTIKDNCFFVGSSFPKTNILQGDRRSFA